jgi:energy-coupling factor transport system substrate-specific component
MNWEFAALAILAAALISGFLWYERTHPGSRMLALVATLAGLAAIGRIAFAPIPNVKPTTDIIFIAGFALGGAPGFVVGAVAALASNLLFGQGPWTPWQMVAWGLCGVFGAIIGRVSGQQLGRIPLALLCGVAGLGFGAIMDGSIWVTYAGGQGITQYLAISATSLPFNIAHALGNIVFALAFGPALLRAVMRYRTRLEVSWSEPAPRGAAAEGAGVATAPLAAIAVALVVAAAALVPASAQAASSPLRAARYLASAQNSDGGWGFSGGSRTTAVATSWTIIGLAAAGYDPLSVRRRGRSPSALLRGWAVRARTTADIERTALALAAAGLSPSTGGLMTRLVRSQRADGSFAGMINLTSYGLLALRASGRSARSRSVRKAAWWITRRQNRDGGFNFARRGGASSIDDTAGALQAIAAAGLRRGSAAQRAGRYLAARQNGDGGYPLMPSGRSNAQSTALAVQALVAAGRNPDRQRRRGARSPLSYIRALQSSRGSIRYARSSTATPVWVTSQSLAALAKRPLPIRIVRR